MKLRPGCLALRNGSDTGQGVTIEVLTHVCTSLVPDREQDALTLVVTRTVLVWSPEVADGDWTINGRNNIGQHDVLGFAGENVTAANTSF